MTRRRLGRLTLAIPILLVALVVVWLGAALVIYPTEYVRRVVFWRGSNVGTYLHQLPMRPLKASPQPYQFPSAPDEDRVEAALAAGFGVVDVESFLADNQTQSLIVIEHGQVRYERYFNGWQRDSLMTSFSVAKSFVSTLVGLAIEQGYIHSVDDPITDYLPELAQRDPRFAQITIRDLLNMASGLDYQATRWFLFNGDDPLTTYYPDQRWISLHNTHIVAPPGTTFSYNKYHPQLLGMILERTTGMSVTAWTQSRLWDPLGMEFAGSWSLDSTTSGFEKLEAGLNARAIDYAKLGQLFLNGGEWNGRQLISRQWVQLATGQDPAGRAPAFGGKTFYGFMWWGVRKPDGTTDFYAAGDHGEYIYVSPANDVVIMRTGVDFGIASDKWIDGFTRTADELGRG